MTKVTADIIHEPGHFNSNCACFIPSAWSALICIDGDQQPKFPCGSTRDEAIDNVLREYPDALIY